MTAAVTATDLVLAYRSKVAVARSSFHIPDNTVTAIIGPNGSGKSTLLNAIAGLHEPAAGTLEVAARRTNDHRVAYVLQTTKVNDALPVTVREVVTMGRYAGSNPRRRLRSRDRSAVGEAMRRTEVVDLAGRHLQELSGGQRQRVFLAQGLAQDHDLLLLDEPLTGIDLPTAQAIDEVIHEEVENGCSVVMTTHDLTEARVADHVVLLAGRVIAAGPPDEVLTTSHLAEAYGSALLHVTDGTVFLDDPAHASVPGPHVHRDRSSPDPTGDDH